MKLSEANRLQNQGITFQCILCPVCEFATECSYRADYEDAKVAQHAIMTHKRAEVQITEIAVGRSYIAVHENPLSMLRPSLHVSQGLEVIGLITKQAERNVGKDDRSYFRRMKEIANELNGCRERSKKTRQTPVPDPADNRPKNPDNILYQTINQLGVTPNGDAMRLVRSVADGLLDELWVKVEERFVANDDTTLVRSLVGFKTTVLPSDATIWVNDATAHQPDVEAILQSLVSDRTPQGSLQRSQPVLQIIPDKDVTLSTTVGSAASLLRGIIYDLPHRKIGVITHKKLCDDGLKNQQIGRASCRERVWLKV
jgi:hypothetical protein